MKGEASQNYRIVNCQHCNVEIRRSTSGPASRTGKYTCFDCRQKAAKLRAKNYKAPDYVKVERKTEWGSIVTKKIDPKHIFAQGHAEKMAKLKQGGVVKPPKVDHEWERMQEHSKKMAEEREKEAPSGV